MPAAAIRRRLLVFCAIGLYAAVFGAFFLFEVPGLFAAKMLGRNRRAVQALATAAHQS